MRAGYLVSDASDGKQAMNKLREQRVDLMIVDIIMPDQEGVETISKLKRDYPGVKIIAISGAVGGKYLKVAQLMGAHAVLRKPFEIADFLFTVRRVLGST